MGRVGRKGTGICYEVGSAIEDTGKEPLRCLVQALSLLLPLLSAPGASRGEQWGILPP